MSQIPEPSSANRFSAPHTELLLSSFYRLTSKHLIDPELEATARYRALNDAPFCVVSHNTASDPIFNYANKMALQQFEMNWQGFTQMPSRHSAEPQIREERERLLKRVTEFGFIDDYQGVRISANGRRFFVEDAIVWNLIDEEGSYRGQAAVLYKWKDL